MDHNGIHYEVDGSGAAVVLIHGFSLDRREWDDQMPALAPHYRVVRMDLRGFGRSAVVSGPYSHAEDVKSVLDALGIPVAHLVGHSFGGGVAGEFAQLYPEATASLVMVSALLTGWPFTRLLQQLQGIAQVALSGDMVGAKRMLLEHELFAGVRSDSRIRERTARIVDNYSGWHLVNLADPQRKPRIATAELLEHLHMSTLVMVGEYEPTEFVAAADEMLARMPDVRKCVIAGAGHMPNLERPLEFNRALLEFLQRVQTALPTPTSRSRQSRSE